MSKREARARRYGQEKETISVGAAALRCFLATVGTAAVLLLLASAIAYTTKDPDRASTAAAWTALALTAVGVGGWANLFLKEKPVPCALAGAGAFVLLLAGIALAMDGSLFPLWMFSGYAAFLLLSVGSAAVIRLIAKNAGTGRTRRRYRPVG